MTDKRTLRAEARERLRVFTHEEGARAGRAIARRVWTLPEMREAKRILLYASTPGEVPTDEIAAEARQRGLDVTYPRCAPSGPAMTLHDVAGPDQLKAGGRYGLREPVAGCRAVTLQEVDVVLLPGLGWDRFGGRLGRGAGFYDRLLAEPGWGGFRCGLFFAAQEFPRIPVDPWDVPLHAVVTEEEVWRLSAGEGSTAPGS